MTGTLVPAISPPRGLASALPSRLARPLPMPSLPARNSSAALYGLAVIDCHGRAADRVVLASLGWSPGQSLRLRVIAGSIVARPDVRGGVAVSTDGHVRLPIGLRRRCGLRTGDRVLLVADPPSGTLLLHPPPVLDELLAVHHCAILGEAVQ